MLKPAADVLVDAASGGACADLAGSFACKLHQMSRLNAALLFQVLLEFQRRLIDAGELQGDL
jgi:hypothetical protein